MDKEEIYEPPPTDPAKALRYAISLIQQQQREAHEREALIRDVNATLILTRKELNELKREYEEKNRIDGWKFLRNIAAKIAGDIDSRYK